MSEDYIIQTSYNFSAHYSKEYTNKVDIILGDLGYKVTHPKAYLLISRDCIDHRCQVAEKFLETNGFNIDLKYVDVNKILEECTEYTLFYKDFTCKGTNLYINIPLLKQNLRANRYDGFVELETFIEWIDVRYDYNSDSMFLRFYDNTGFCIREIEFDANYQQAKELAEKFKKGMPKSELEVI